MTDLSPELSKKKRGAQPGNLNALKHGLYIEGRSIRNTTPIERAQLFDLIDIITYTKKYILATYEEGMKSKTLDDFNVTLRSIAIASTGLSRLINLHNQFQNSSLPTDFVVTKKTTVMNLVDHYKKKTSAIIDLSDLETSRTTETPLPPVGEGRELCIPERSERGAGVRWRLPIHIPREPPSVHPRFVLFVFDISPVQKQMEIAP